jgi:hypothetical protein
VRDGRGGAQLVWVRVELEVLFTPREHGRAGDGVDHLANPSRFVAREVVPIEGVFFVGMELWVRGKKTENELSLGPFVDHTYSVVALEFSGAEQNGVPAWRG